MTANEKQVGGEHYRREGSVATQHWDLVEDNGIGYLEAVATKYVSRWRIKNGVQDLEKAAHYVEKLIENVQTKGRRPRGIVSGPDLAEFANEYELAPVEMVICTCLLRWSDVGSLETALRELNALIEKETGNG